MNKLRRVVIFLVLTFLMKELEIDDTVMGAIVQIALSA